LEGGGSEVTDAIVPFSVLAESKLVDVVMTSQSSEPVRLFPAVTVRPHLHRAAFDRDHPQGADYVIVPAALNPQAPELIEWVGAQAAKGAKVVGICAGGLVLAEAGLLDGQRGTTHWYERRRLQRRSEGMKWVSDRRFVVDGNVVTTTGVTASVPLSMTLVEAIGGREHASTLAARLGVEDWSAAHESDRFRLDLGGIWMGLSGRLKLWRVETLAVPVSDKVHELALALTVDAWARTDRARPVLVASDSKITTRHGLELLIDEEAPSDGPSLPRVSNHAPVSALDQALRRIRQRYGPSVADWVALQLEYAVGLA